MDVDKECSVHGLTTFKPRGKYFRCRKCAADAVRRKRKKTLDQFVELLGGKCTICGYGKCNRALEFHHIDPKQKKHGIKDGRTYAFDKWLEEVKKCVLLCANCHREVEEGITKCPSPVNLMDKVAVF